MDKKELLKLKNSLISLFIAMKLLVLSSGMHVN